MRSIFKQFSVKTLLIVVSIMGLMFGGLAWWQRAAVRQKRIVQTIEELGGRVYYDFHVEGRENSYFGDFSRVEYNYGVLSPLSPQGSKPVATPWLYDLIGVDYFASVVAVFVPDPQVDLPLGSNPADSYSSAIIEQTIQSNNELLNSLRGLKRVEELSLGFVTAADQQTVFQELPSLRRVIIREEVGVQCLEALRNTSVVEFEDCWKEIDDSGLEALSGAPSLRKIEMPLLGKGVLVTDRGVKSIADLELSRLTLNSELVTEESSAEFAKMHHLTELYLRAPGLNRSIPELLEGKDLRQLALVDMTIEEDVFSAISQHPNLELLVVIPKGEGDTSLGYEAAPPLPPLAIRELTKLKRLRVLELDYQISREDLLELADKLSLQQLAVGNHISAAEFDEIQQMLPSVELWRSNWRADDQLTRQADYFGLENIWMDME